MHGRIEMSILNYFKCKVLQETDIFCQHQSTNDTSISEEEVAVCNKEVETEVQEQNEKQVKQCHSYTSQQQANIRRYAAQHGPMAAAQHIKTTGTFSA